MSDLPIWRVPSQATVAAVLAFTPREHAGCTCEDFPGEDDLCRVHHPDPVVRVVGVPNRPTVTTCPSCGQDHTEETFKLVGSTFRDLRPGEQVRVVTDTQPEIGAMFGEWEVRPPAMHPDVHLDGYPRLVSGDVELRIPDPGAPQSDPQPEEPTP